MNKRKRPYTGTMVYIKLGTLLRTYFEPKKKKKRNEWKSPFFLNKINFNSNKTVNLSRAQAYTSSDYTQWNAISTILVYFLF